MTTVKVVTLNIDSWDSEDVGIAVNLKAAKKLAQHHSNDRLTSWGDEVIVLHWDSIKPEYPPTYRYWKAYAPRSDGYIIHTEELHS
jgi:hypothetical protein